MNKLVFILFLTPIYQQVFSQETAVIDSIRSKINLSSDNVELAGLFNDLAWEYSLINYDSASKYTDKAIYLSNKIADPYWQAVSYEMKAILYEISAQYEEAIKLYLEVIDLREKTGEQGLENTFNNVAILFKNQNNHKKALEYFHKSYLIELEKNHKRGVIASLNNMAVSLKDLGDTDSAFALNKSALKMAIDNHDEEYIVYSTINQAKHYYDLKEYDSALFYNLSVMDKARRLQMYGPLATALQMNAEIFINRGKYHEAMTYLDDAERLATSINTKEFLRTNYQSRTKAYEGLQAFDKAYEYLKKYVSINDSIINDHSIRVLNELEKKYETAKKDENIARLNELNAKSELETERQANLNRIITFSSIFLILAGLLITLILRQRLKNQRLLAQKNEELKTTNFKRKLTELEMKALRSQMNPHFIFNCMNSINTMILNGESENASKYLNKFSKLIRLTLENSENSMISLEDELSMLEAYIQLESVRFKGKINYEILIDSDIEKSSIHLPAMVLQPFIENAIWHGLMHKEGPGIIKITIKEEGDELKCSIEDDGIGREMALKLTDKLPYKNKSMGLKITEERLKLIHHNQLKDWIQIIDLKDSADNAIGTRVDISIPIN